MRGMPAADAPTTELGSPGLTGGTGPFGGVFLSPFEETQELLWPNNVLVYDRMRRTDAQVSSVLRAITLPIRRTGWHLEGEDVDPAVIRWLELELGLAQRSGGARRRRQGVEWDPFLRQALLSLPLGLMPFEQVYEVGAPQAELAGGPLPPLVAHLRKLAPRMPRTLTSIDVARDGGLEAIRQTFPRQDGTWQEVRIPVDRLVMFVHEREGADWTGQSILRSAYKHWLIKDALLRLGPIAVERNGMGLPVVSYPSAGGDRALALDLARKARAGEDAGVALPEGYTLELKGVTGATRDELPLLKYHDEAIGRNALAMFLDLGHDRGARSLGDTFVDYFLLSLNSVAESIASTITEHVIRDLVELNLGPDAPYPALVADPLEAGSDTTAEALASLTTAGLLTPDRELEQDVRRRHGLPSRPEPEEREPEEDVAGSPFADVGLPALVDAGIMDAEEARAILGLPPGAPIPADATIPASALSAHLARRSSSSSDDGLAELEARFTAAQARLAALRQG